MNVENCPNNKEKAANVSDIDGTNRPNAIYLDKLVQMVVILN